MVPAVPDVRDGAVVLRQRATAEGQGLRLHGVWQAARHRQWPHRAAGFARAEFAVADPRETDRQPRAMERLERKAEDSFRERMAGERDDELHRRRRMARV